jgi:hypothetical protein
MYDPKAAELAARYLIGSAARRTQQRLWIDLQRDARRGVEDWGVRVAAATTLAAVGIGGLIRLYGLAEKRRHPHVVG